MAADGHALGPAVSCRSVFGATNVLRGEKKVAGEPAVTWDVWILLSQLLGGTLSQKDSSADTWCGGKQVVLHIMHRTAQGCWDRGGLDEPALVLGT